MKTDKVIAVILGLGLIIAFVFAGCDMSGGTQKENAKAPEITTQPAGYEFDFYGDEEYTLTVVANSTDGGVLSYQWYSNTSASTSRGTPISGANDADYTVTLTDDGVYYFYVVVTNTNSRATGTKTASATSNVAQIIANDPTSAAYPNISAQSNGGTFYADTGVPTVLLSVTASVNDGGTLSYQWYSNTSESTEGGTLIEGATASSYEPQGLNTNTEYFYYVVITNFNDAEWVTTEQTRTSTSIPVTVVVSPDTYNATFTVNTAAEYQYVRGFGGMDTPWDNVPGMFIQDYEKMYNPGNPDDPGDDTGLGYNIMRMMILPWNIDIDITMRELTVGRVKEIDEVEQFVADRPYQYEGVKIVNKYNGYVFACPWSPPMEWKTNDSTIGGGRLKAENYQDFADYLNRFAQHMWDRGAPIYAMSMQNEPTVTVSYDGCEYTPTEHLNWWLAVGKFTAGRAKGWGNGQEQPYVRTMSGEPHGDPTAFLNPLFNNEAARESVDLVGRHIYGSYNDSTGFVGRYGEPFRKETWMTEHNINSGAGSYEQDSTWNYMWKFMNDIDLSIRMNKENAFIWWTAKRFYSMIGDGQSGTIDGMVLPRGYGLSHYAKFAKEMRHVDLTSSGALPSGAAISSSNFNPAVYNVDGTAARASAFVSEDGNTISVVMWTPTNPNGANGVNMGLVKIELPEGFTVGKAIAMRSTAASGGRTVTEQVSIRSDGKAAFVTLPASNILSVRFTK